MKISFLHPDLGLGGAERLVVDAASALAEKGHDVTIFTSHYDTKRCFPQTRDGKFRVRCRGDFLPRHVFGKGHILFAIVRSVYLAICASFFPADLFVTDQISFYNFILSIMKRQTPIIFYCHFPDKLLAPRGSMLRNLYRALFDRIEEASTGCCDLILANSHFTKGVFEKHYASLRNETVEVLHPATKFERKMDTTITARASRTFISINRFERKKNIALAMHALSSLRNKLGKESFEREKIRLVVAGGYDPRVAENVEYHKELATLAKTLKLNDESGGNDHVVFVKSFSEEEKADLLKNCLAVLYTPDNEHFGIVPLECMAAGRPVLAMNSGGPTETIVHEKTGFLCSEQPAKWASHMKKLVDDPSLALKMGKAGIEHVDRNFSFRAFQEKLNKHVSNTQSGDRRKALALLLWLFLVPVAAAYCAWAGVGCFA